mmetsp:Transcript_16662/g.33604  ORF Transcript_16662/g.33604 Transcript_16662/m.33604 type:complete len:315 (+) Transcript_16662:593-1537(+)
MFGDGVGFDLDDLTSGNLVTGTVANRLLVLLDGGAVDNGSSSDTNVVVLGEDPSVKVGRHIITNVHFSHFFVEFHLVVRDLNAFLEGNGKVVLASIHSLGNTRVGTISTNNKVNVHGLGNTSRRSFLVFLVVDSVLAFRRLVVGRNVNAGDQSVDGDGTVSDGAVTKESVQDLATGHTNVLVGFQSRTNGDFDTGGGDEIHLADLTVDLVFRNVELSDHAERNGTTTRLGVVHLAFEENGVNSLFLGKDLGSAGTGRSPTDDGDLVLHAERARGSRHSSNRLARKGRGREGRGGSDKRRKGNKGELHRCWIAVV